MYDFLENYFKTFFIESLSRKKYKKKLALTNICMVRNKYFYSTFFVTLQHSNIINEYKVLF